MTKTNAARILDAAGRKASGPAGALPRRGVFAAYFREGDDPLGRAVIEHFEIGCVESGDGIAVRIADGEGRFHQVRFRAQDGGGRRVRVRSNRDFFERRLRAKRRTDQQPCRAVSQRAIQYAGSATMATA